MVFAKKGSNQFTSMTAGDGRSCPDEDTIGRYLDNLLDEPGKTKLIEHLKQCSSCKEQIEALTGIKAEIEDENNLIPVPEKIRQEAINLFSLVKPRNMLDIVIECIKGEWQLMKHTGVVSGLTPALAVVRGKEEDKAVPYFSIKKEFDTCTINTEIECTMDDLFTLRVDVIDKKQNLPLKGVDMKLMDSMRKRKLEEITCDGQAAFEEIRAGLYKLELALSGEELGQINLRIAK